MTTKISAFYPNYFYESGIAYAALSVVEAMQSENMKLSLMGIASNRHYGKPFYRNALPDWSKSLFYRFLKDAQIKRFSEFRFLYSLKDQDIAYLWPGVSLGLYKEIHRRGHKIIREAVNTHQSNSKSILDAEYSRLGLKATHGITAANVEEESAKLELTDYVFSCSPMVTQSLLNADVPKQKILQTSYGLKEADILKMDNGRKPAVGNNVTAIFVGTIGVRKGPHLLLDYWCRSGVQGKLRIVGDIQPEVRHIIEPYLRRPDIEHVPYVDNLSDIYEQADIFLLPSLEEGSPLVTYMALGAGLACLVSPMGGGGIVEHGKQGLVMDPHDAESWIDALQRVAGDAGLREEFSRNAYQKAPDYLWSQVGKKRAHLLLDN
ncbi:D-inositol 3-phosphate glycosyltransferase [Methylophilaceae bacterium]|nr:D-inositol 3-phosphate glycosyltransferase [Methylophilaceae bacterium]